ncbi:putative aldouronate transport system substrate-binding protein [Kribbella steppae]|uniref:Putative aldouronate transport system substrate-binding protein n=1 Tax=Kribbella steppae TaxID=2512223 RepID=A0A4R2H960_9ACTN|nr:extracellular solute-binding protein [Kribbella steppae]TCO23322.1 putative aldouronate transport system substrate-binding protein [Kribbella steppae]
MPNNAARSTGISRRSLIAGALGLTAATAGGGLLSGCSGSSNASGAGGGGAAPAPPSVTLGPKLEGVLYPDGYVGPVARELKPITSEKVTFKIVVKQDVTIGDWKTNAFTKWLEQKTNIHIEWNQVGGTDDDVMTKVNAMIAAGDIPDAFMGIEFTRSQLYLYGQQGLFTDVNQFIDGYALNLQQAMKDYPDARKLVQAPDKKIYSFPSINDCYHCRASNGRTFLNTDWIKQVGLDVPKTTDEFREVLRAFKKADLGGNGRTIPFCGYKDAPFDTYFMNSFLYNPGDPWLVVNDGKVDVNFNKDEWREGLKYIHGLYAEGLINKDVFTADQDQMDRYGNAPGKPIIGGARSYYWGGFLDIDQKDPDARWRKYLAVPPVKGPNNVQYAAWNYLGVGVEVAKLVITKKCAKPELLVQWADAQMELEAILRGYGGPKFAWAKKGELGINGKQAVYGFSATWNTEKNISWSQDNAMYRSQDFRLAERVNPKDLTFESPLYQQTVDNYFPYKQPQEMQFPPVTLDQDQAAQEAELKTNLTSEVNLSFSKFVTGQLDPNDDAAWNDYKDRVEKIGVKPYLELEQAAYETYNA